MKTQVIIDTDPGPDNGVAILTALGSPLIEVLGVCAVADNVPLHHTVRNVRKILELAKRPDVRAFAGAEAPVAALSQTFCFRVSATGVEISAAEE